MSVARSIITSHLVSGKMDVGEEISIRIDQTLTQDATGTLVMLELEAMDLDRVKTELSAQYVDHNLLQEDYKNADDHLFLRSACRKFGLWYSAPGNGISHVVHQENFGLPGKTLLGSDSHTPAAGSLGMIAIGAGGLEVAMAMAGEPFYVKMPKIVGVELTGKLPEWVSAKDVVLEMLRRHGVRGGRGKIFEYFGEGVEELSIMDRHVIANMGTEMGATTSIFPSDRQTEQYLKQQDRGAGFTELLCNPKEFDQVESLNLQNVEPLLATPSSPGNIRKVSEFEGKEIYQSYIGSSANPGYRDFVIVAEILKNKKAHSGVSLDINPSSRQTIATLARDGYLLELIKSGGRMHQTGCNGCIGMGQAPATDKISLRTVPRNFPGRSGTLEDQVYLVSPETAAASALMGKITDPRNLEMEYPKISENENPLLESKLLEEPLPTEQAQKEELRFGPNIKKLPIFSPLPDNMRIPVLLKVQDDLSTDEILPAGAKVLPYRSNIPKISEFSFYQIDPDYVQRTESQQGKIQHIIIAGENYGQGSSREHAAIAPRHLGLVVVIAKGFARIHWQNLVNFGALPLTFKDPEMHDKINLTDVISFNGLHEKLRSGREFQIELVDSKHKFTVCHDLSSRQIEIIACGGLINWQRQK